MLGVLVATDIFVSNSIVNNLSEMGHSSSEEASESLEQSEGAFYIYLFLHGCFLTVCGLKSLYHIWFHFYVCNSSLVVCGSYNSLTSYHAKFIVMGMMSCARQRRYEGFGSGCICMVRSGMCRHHITAPDIYCGDEGWSAACNLQ